MRRTIVRVFFAVLVVGVVVFSGLAGWAQWVIRRDYSQVPLPPIAANASPAAIERGELLFQSLCMECHAGADGRATGKRLDEVPAFLGTMWSANLAHAELGVHRRSDGELARVLRHGVQPNGRLSVAMNGFKHIGDDDVAAILGYIRSRPPVFEPAGGVQPRTRLSLVGSLILTWVAKVGPEASPTRIAVPAKGPTVEYGRYMATVLDCVGCHTVGFGDDKLRDPAALAGGLEFTDPTGVPIFSRNITFDEATGIGRWSVDDLERAVTRGVRPEGTVVRKPMPLFSRLDRTDVEALYRFLQSMPKVKQPNTPGGQPVARPQPGEPAEVLFVKVGCAACHGEAGPYRDKLLTAEEKTDGELTEWILDPQASKPGSAMPSFKGVLDHQQAEDLARYVKAVARRRRG